MKASREQKVSKDAMVSVILPSLNVAPYIGKCLKSVVNQDYKNIEIICVDAGSTDGTTDIIKKYRDQYQDKFGFQCYFDTRKSYGYQVNLGIRNSHGKYIAILETDDYVDKHMYGDLVKIAEEKELDFVKADFYRFTTLRDGYILKNIYELFPFDRSLYDREIACADLPYLNANDYNVWKGIYNRKFLLRNEIWFMESAGAAFQDIGFAELVLACAAKGFYINTPYYMYRCDRDEASVRSCKGLSYSLQEFQRLMEDENLWAKIRCRQGFFWHMAQSFHGELSKILELENYDYHSPYIEPYFAWFVQKLKQAMKDGFLPAEGMFPRLCDDILMILDDRDAYAAKLKKANDEKKKEKEMIRCFLDGSTAVIFGAGKLGKALLGRLLREDVADTCVVDNDPELWGTLLYHKNISSPQEVLQKYCDGVPFRFLIANKYHSAEIRQQLLDAGVKEEDIRENP